MFGFSFSNFFRFRKDTPESLIYLQIIRIETPLIAYTLMQGFFLSASQHFDCCYIPPNTVPVNTNSICNTSIGNSPFHVFGEQNIRQYHVHSMANHAPLYLPVPSLADYFHSILAGVALLTTAQADFVHSTTA